ncbi:MAG: TonB-dependent receptor [Deltaproteobacteria bacterium]|nr:TonB-dependent receptor [Deltaproteobacteria bacterium]
MPFLIDRKASLLLLCLCVARTSFAGEASLGEILVTPSTPIRPGGGRDSSLSATVIERKDFEQKKSSLAEVLSETAGVQIRRYGGLDDFATVSLRGSTSEQVAVYLDGVLLNSAEGGGVNLAAIPTDQIERIEVYRGAAPSFLGTSPMGGVVLIQTKKASQDRTTRFSGSYGSFNTLETSLHQSEQFHQSHYAVDYHFSRSDGDFDFQSDNGTPLNPNDDQTLVRTNNEFQRHQMIFKTGTESKKESRFEFQEIFFREDRGVPGLGSLISENADLSTTRSATKIDWSRKNLNLSPFFTFQKQQFTDLEGEIGLGSQDNDNDTFSYGADSAAFFLLGTTQRFTFSANYRGEQFLPDDFISPPDNSKSIRNQIAVGLEDEIVLFEDKIILNPSLRSEHVVSDFSTAESSVHPVSGKLGARWIPDQRFSLRSSFARAYRVASFSELFGDRGSLIGNPTLSPEQGWNWDAGFLAKTDFFSLESTYYLNHLKDLIQVLQTSQFTAQAQNLRSARVQGVETTLAIPLTSFLEISNNYTFQWPKDTSGLPGSDGKFLPGRPRHEANSKLSLFNRFGKIYSSLEYIDDNFLDTQNLVRVDNRVLWGVGISWTPTKRITTGFDAKNLLNDRISDVVGFSLPGRSFYGRVDVSI